MASLQDTNIFYKPALDLSPPTLYTTTVILFYCMEPWIECLALLLCGPVLCKDSSACQAFITWCLSFLNSFLTHSLDFQVEQVYCLSAVINIVACYLNIRMCLPVPCLLIK